MKRLVGYTLALALVVGGCPAVSKPARADWGVGIHVSFDFFFGRLRPYGHWVHVPRYGHVWYPVGVGRYWQPYSNGYWAYTEFGWTWISYDPFGEIPFHYGAWTLLPTYGWVWVPGYVWAPAWVTWRYGPSYVGWAPLPPDYGFYYGSACPPVTVIDRAWVFVPPGHVGSRNIPGARLPYHQNGHFISGTQPVTNLTFVKDHVFNPGPGGPPAGGGSVGGGGVNKFNIRQARLEQLGMQPQPVADLKRSRAVSVATPYTAKSLPKVDGASPVREPSGKGSSGRQGYDARPGDIPRRDDVGDKIYLDPQRDVIQPKPSPRSEREDKFNAPRSGGTLEPAPGRTVEPKSRSEKPSYEPQFRQPVPGPETTPKSADRPKTWPQPRSMERPTYQQPAPSRQSDVVKPPPSSREKPSRNSSINRDRGRSLEKAPRHVYQPPVKTSPARSSGAKNTGSRGGTPTKKGKP